MSKKKKLSHMNYIALLCKRAGLKKKPTEAILANCKAESSYNPRAIQDGLMQGTGFGLFQWSVNMNISLSTIHDLLMKSNKDSIKWQVKYMLSENGQWIKGGSYPQTFAQFKRNRYGLSRRKLTIAFMQQWERPAWHTKTAGNQRFVRWLPDFHKLRW